MKKQGVSPLRGRERAFFRQTGDAAQQELDLSIGSAGGVLRHHVAGEADGDPGQAALGVGGAEDAGAGEGALAGVVVVGHEEVVRRLVLEPERAVPRHVLDRQQRAVGDQDVVQRAVGDDGAVETLDDARQHGQAAGRGVVRVEDAVGAFGPWLDGRVDGLLHVASVEVDLRPVRKVVERAREAQHVPEQRAGRRDLVHVEARVDERDGVEDIVPDRTAVGSGVREGRERAFGRIDEAIVQVRCVAARVGTFVEVCCEGCIQGEEGSEVIDVSDGRDFSVSSPTKFLFGSTYSLLARPVSSRLGRRSRSTLHHSISCRLSSTWHLQYTARIGQHNFRL